MVLTPADSSLHVFLSLFIQIYSGGHLHHFIDGYDVQRSNWMRFVNPARSGAEQNLVACQNGQEIFFYTLRPVEPEQELLVWYSPEFSQRLCGQPVQPDRLKPSESRWDCPTAGSGMENWMCFDAYRGFCFSSCVLIVFFLAVLKQYD